MTPLFKKLNLKDRGEILALNAPDSFDGEIRKLPAIRFGEDAQFEMALEAFNSAIKSLLNLTIWTKG